MWVKADQNTADEQLQHSNKLNSSIEVIAVIVREL